MSYNTRRTGGGAPAAGRTSTPTTQVNYHQQPATRTGAPQSRNPGYSTTPQTGYNSTGYNTQSQPAFTTQPPAQPAPPVQQKPAQPTPLVQPSTPAPKPPAQPQQTPPAVKQEPITPAGTPQNTPATSEATENGEAPAPKPPHWKNRPHFKLSNKVRRARQNARLRRTLNPKTALTFLNELRPLPGGVKFVVREEAGWGFMASVDIDGKLFSGHGLTVNKAKSVAAEQALKFLLLERMSKKSETPSVASTDKEGDQEAKKEETEQDEKMEVETKEGEGETTEAKKAKKAEEDNYENELPWGSLAAFALHKLFTEWQREGITEWQRDSIEMPYPDKYEEETSEDHFPARRPPGPGPVDEYGYSAPGPRRFRPFPQRGRGFGPYPGPRGPPPNFRMPRALGPPPAATFLGGSFKGPSFPMGGPAKPQALLPMRKIPDDANTRHPVMLLNQLKPQVVYNEEKEGVPPGDMFKITVEHDGQEFVGRAKSKKEAKKRAAKAVLSTMGVHYPDDD